MPIELLFAEDESCVRTTMTKVIEHGGEFAVVAAAGDGLEALELYKAQRPDICLVDMRLPGLNGVDLIRAICAIDSDARIVSYTADDSSQTLRRAVNAGACAHVCKGENKNELLAALHAAAAGQNYFSKRFLPAICADFVAFNRERSESDHGALSPRERQVLQLIAEGYTGPQVALKLKISARTVDGHRRSICDKTGASGGPGLVMLALRLGLIHPDGHDVRLQ